MMTGKVKWFSSAREFGFIIPDDGGDDVYVHLSAVRDSGIVDLFLNQKVSFDMKKHRKKMIATNIKVIEVQPK